MCSMRHTVYLQDYTVIILYCLATETHLCVSDLSGLYWTVHAVASIVASADPQWNWKGLFHSGESVFWLWLNYSNVRCIFETTVGLLFTADNSVPLSPASWDSSRWIGTVAGRVDPQGFAETMPLSACGWEPNPWSADCEFSVLTTIYVASHIFWLIYVLHRLLSLLFHPHDWWQWLAQGKLR